ncbi:MAG: hypothetical protein ACTFAL_03005 [Candidatus Electronema sp. V4]|uniref:hypothetical protein n=1 Tax=Candidatus Electronema sp. V4 TaxID=3454756 RepID=UPI0040558F95
MLEQQLRFIRKHRRGAATLLVLLCVCIAAATLRYCELLPLPLKNLSFQEGELLDLIMSLSVMAVFMERAVEAVLVPVRTPDRQEIEHEIETLRAELAQMGEEKQTLSLVVKTKERELEIYRLNTARYAYWLSFALGMAVSLVGIRALSGLIDQDALTALSNPQLMLFSLVDVVITGGVIAGGSAAVDKMGRRISKSFDLTSATTSTLKEKKENCPPQNGSEAA